MVAMGTMIIITGFLAFNSASSMTISSRGDHYVVSRAAANTIICAAGGFLGVLFMKRVTHKQWLLVPATCGALSGCVASACEGFAIEGWAAVIIGLMAGQFTMGLSSLLLKLRVDDVVDAVPVHWGGGLVGCLSLAFFKINDGILYNWDTKSGYVSSNNRHFFFTFHLSHFNADARLATYWSCSNYSMGSCKFHNNVLYFETFQYDSG